MQLKNKFIEAATGATLTGVDGSKFRLQNNQVLRARNAANSADISIIKVNASDVIEMQGLLSMNSNRITNVTNPSGAQDAATKNYVDTTTSLTIGTIDSQTKSANGGVISGTSLVFQTADATSPGLISTGSQTIAGVKSFSTDIRSTTSQVSNLGDATHLWGSSFIQNYWMYDTAGTLRGDLSGNATTGVLLRSTSALPLTLLTTAGGGATQSINMSTGNAGGGASGDINLLPGTATTTRGTVNIGTELRLNGSTSGYVGIKATATPTSYTVIMPSAQGGASTVLTNDGSGNLSWGTPSSGVTTVAAIDTNANANGLFISGSNISTQSASVTNPGMVNTTTQSFIGVKSFRSNVNMYDTVGGFDRMTLSALTARPSGPSGPSLIGKGNADLGIFTESAAASQSLSIETGNASAGGSGFITLQTGTASGTRGSIVLNANDVSVSVVTSLSMNSKKIVSLLDPTAAQDAATKNYVDNLVNGLSWKQEARAATTANITLSGAQTIDGVSVIAGDRVLVKNQSTASQNGIYVAAAGAWSRSTDADAGSELVAASIFVDEGTANAATAWVQTTAAPITIGSTSIVFVQFSSASYTFGNGLQNISNTISVLAADTSLNVSGAGVRAAYNTTGALETSTGIRVRVDASTIKINGSNNLETLKPKQENLTLNGTDITNQYKDLAFAVYGASASDNSISLSVAGGPMQLKATDYTVSLTGGSGGVTRITFAGDLATGGNAALISGDILMISYEYLT